MSGNPYSSKAQGLGPLMRDVKNKICTGKKSTVFYFFLIFWKIWSLQLAGTPIFLLFSKTKKFSRKVVKSESGYRISKGKDNPLYFRT